MKKVRVPSGEGELLVLVGLLEAAGIRYFIQNENISSLYPGLQGDSLWGKAIWVGDEDEGRAKDVARAFLEKTGQGPEVGE
jgi:hypothetical protein